MTNAKYLQTGNITNLLYQATRNDRYYRPTLAPYKLGFPFQLSLSPILPVVAIGLLGEWIFFISLRDARSFIESPSGMARIRKFRALFSKVVVKSRLCLVSSRPSFLQPSLASMGSGGIYHVT